MAKKTDLGSGSERVIAVCVVDDDEGMRHFVSRALSKRGFEVHVAPNAEDALVILSEHSIDVVVSDVRMPGMGGVGLLDVIKEKSPGTRMILMTAYGAIDQAIAALKNGAENYLTKPFETEELLLIVERAAEKSRLDEENRMLRELLRSRDAYGGLVGAGKVMRRLFHRIESLAKQGGAVFIHGESGTGKELVARAIHDRSRVKNGPFVGVPCGALPPKLVSVELFGAEQGAFTGADRARRGYVERADQGTLYLDGVGELPLEAQPALLRFLETGEIHRVGGGEPVKTSVRVVASSSVDLRELVREGRMKDELFYRLNVLTVAVPPLRDHTEDIPLLFTHFLEQAGRPDLSVPPHVFAHLQGLPFPGNVRELANLAERVAHSITGSSLELEDLPLDLAAKPELPARGSGQRPYRQALEDFERGYLEELLLRTGGNVSEAARVGGISRPSLHARILALGIDVVELRRRPS